MQNHVIYSVSQPKDTHFRRATCEETRCPRYLLGWKTLIDESSGFGQAQARYIRVESGREFTEERDQAGLTVFTFHPGQTCFGRKHYLPIERDAVFEKIKPGREPLWMYGQDWIDDNKEHLFKLKRLYDEG